MPPWQLMVIFHLLVQCTSNQSLVRDMFWSRLRYSLDKKAIICIVQHKFAFGVMQLHSISILMAIDDYFFISLSSAMASSHRSGLYVWM